MLDDSQPAAPAAPPAARSTPRAWLILGRLALVGALAAGIWWAVAVGRAGGRWREGEAALAAGHYWAAQTALEDAIHLAPPGGAPGFSTDRARLALSWAYLALRAPGQAAAVLPGAAAPGAEAALALQHGRIAAAAGDTAAAGSWFRRAGAAAPGPGSREARAALWHRGELAWRAGDPAAGALFATLAATPAPPHDPYRLAANVRLAASTAWTDPAAAHRALTAARADLPADPAAAAGPDLRLLDLDLDEGLPAAVISDTIPRLEADLQGAGAVQAAGPTALDIYWGHALAGLEAWPQAAALLARAVAADPTLADAHAYLGLAQERMGQRATAEIQYRTALRLAPDRELARHLLARLLIAAGRPAEAQPLLQAVLAANPDSVIIHLDLAACAQAQGQYAVVESELQLAEQVQAAGGAPAEEGALDPALLLAEFYFLAGNVHHDCTLARSAATRAAAGHPAAPEFAALGWAAHLCGDDAAARAALDRAVAADPHLAMARYRLGMVLKALGDPGARAALEAARDLDPGGFWDQRAVAAIAAP